MAAILRINREVSGCQSGHHFLERKAVARLRRGEFVRGEIVRDAGRIVSTLDVRAVLAGLRSRLRQIISDKETS